MKVASKLLMGVSMAVVVGVGVVLALLLVLLAELYCSLLLRKRKLDDSNDAATTTTTATVSQEDTSSPLSSIYAHGVIQAPRSILFPAITGDEEEVEIHKQHKLQSKLKYVDHEIRIEELNMIWASSTSPPYAPQTSQEAMRTEGRKSNSSSSGSCSEHFVYISNPIYNNKEVCRGATPFETPDTSPSRLGIGGSSPSSDTDDCHGLP